MHELVTKADLALALDSLQSKLMLGLTIRLGGMIGTGIAALAVLQLRWVA
jgi:hypothetical protein